MSQTQTIDVSKLPPPNVVEPLDFENIFAGMLSDLRLKAPLFSAMVESDPAYKILQVCAYRELLIRQRVNEAGKSVMVVYANGADLDNIGANYGIGRLLIVPADNKTVPPKPAIFERDDDFRSRLILSLDRYTTAGSIGSYRFHAMSSSGDVKDVAITSSRPGFVEVAVLSRLGDGSASQELIAQVTSGLNKEDVRPLCDTVSVLGSSVTKFSIVATLTLSIGTMDADVMAAGTIAVQSYCDQNNKIGKPITRAGIVSALFQPGVVNVNLTSPANDLQPAWNETFRNTGITLSVGGRV